MFHLSNVMKGSYFIESDVHLKIWDFEVIIIMFLIMPFFIRNTMPLFKPPINFKYKLFFYRSITIFGSMFMEFDS